MEEKSVYNLALFLLFLQSNFILFCKILFCYGSFVLALLLLLSVENIHCDSITKKIFNLYTRKLSVFSLKKCPILLYFYVIFEMCLIFLLLLLLMVGIYCANEIKVFLLLF